MTQLELIHVDDHIDFRDNTREYLLESGFETEGFVHGDYAEFKSSGNKVLRVAIVDSCGFEFAAKCREKDEQFRAIVLCSEEPTVDSSFAEHVFTKKMDDWPERLVEVIGKLVGENSIRNRRTLDIFADSACVERLRGKVGVVGGVPEKIVKVADNLSAALDWLNANGSDESYRIVQGAPADSLSLEELMSD